MKRVLSLIIAMLLAISSFGTFQINASEQPYDLNDAKRWVEILQNAESLSPELKAKQEMIQKIMDGEEKTVRVIIEVEEPSILEVMSDKRVTFEQLGASSVKSIQRRVGNKIDSVKNTLNQKGLIEKVVSEHSVSFSGFVANVNSKDLDQLMNARGVKNVFISEEYYLPAPIKPFMNSSTEMINAPLIWNDYKYKGEGTKIAVIDSGIDIEHEAMTLTTSNKDALTEEQVNELIKKHGLVGKYYSPKVPYGYNYFDQNFRIKDEGPAASQHGMHVGGTVAANSETLKGVAPEAQIFAMKVFGNDPIYATTYEDVYAQAIDDAIILGADAINMSLGSPAGTDDNPDSFIAQVIKKATDAGVVVVIANGNESHTLFGAEGMTREKPWAVDRDYGTPGTPAVNKHSFAVASINNEYITTNVFKYGNLSAVSERVPHIAYIVENDAYSMEYLEEKDMVDDILDAANDGKLYILAAEDYVVDATGNEVNVEELPKVVKYHDVDVEEDRLLHGEAEEADTIEYALAKGNPTGKHEYVVAGKGNPDEIPAEVKGKYALIERGGITFGQKVDNAYNKGAIGVIVRDNEPHDRLTNMQLDNEAIPSLFISYEDGQKLLNAEEKFVEFGHKKTYKPADSMEMSDFSSRGPSPILSIKPEITAPGGNILSTMNNNKYEYMSGTSMASPHVAGASALVSQYLKDVHADVRKDDRARLIKTILMNTTTIVEDKAGNPYAVRKQGAGLMNLKAALDTRVYAEAVLEGKLVEPKFELGAQDTNTVTLPYKLTSFGEAAEYDIEVVAVRDILQDFAFGKVNTLDTEKVEVKYVEGAREVSVPANGTAKGSITVELGVDENDYLEGWIIFKSKDDKKPSLQMPFLGFYGNWDEIRMFDTFAQEIDDVIAGKVLPSVFNFSLMARITNGRIGIMEDAPSVSNQAFAKAMGGDNFFPVFSLLRNAKHVTAKIKDNNDKVLFTIDRMDNLRKSYYNRKYGRYFYVADNFAYQADKIANLYGGQGLEDGEYKYVLEGVVPGGKHVHKKELKFYVDSTDPIIKDIAYDRENQKLTFTAKDNEGGVGLLGIILVVNRLQGNLPLKDDKTEVVINENTPGVKIIDAEEGKYEFDLTKISEVKDKDGNVVFVFDPNSGYKFLVNAIDKAMNIQVKSYDSKAVAENKDNDAYIYVIQPELIDAVKENVVIGQGVVRYDNEGAQIFYQVNEAPRKKMRATFDTQQQVDLGQGRVEVFAGYSFQERIALEEGLNTIKFIVCDKDGKEINNVHRVIFVDTNAPRVTVESIVASEEEPTAKIKLKIEEEFPYFEIKIDGEFIDKYDEDTAITKAKGINKEFEFDFNRVKPGKNKYKMVVADIAGNITEKEIEIDSKFLPDIDITEALDIIKEFEEMDEKNLNDFGQVYREIAIGSKENLKTKMDEVLYKQTLNSLKLLRKATITLEEEKAVVIDLHEEGTYGSFGSKAVSIKPEVKNLDVAAKYYLGYDAEKAKDLGVEHKINGSPKKATVTLTTAEGLEIMTRTIDLKYTEVETPNVVSIQKISYSKNQGQNYMVGLKIMNSGKSVVDHKVSYKVVDPSGNEVASGEGKTNAQGVYMLTYTIPEDAELGQWKVVFTAEGETPQTDTFTVKAK